MALLGTLLAAGQSQISAHSATLQGSVRDPQRRPLPAVTVYLRAGDGKLALTAQTDAKGVYRFSALDAGTFSLHAEMTQYGEATFSPLVLGQGESREVDLTLEQPTTLARPSPATGAPEFFDQPQFTVAGVTDTTNVGGHISDTVVRNREVLAKEAVGLGKESPQPASATATEESLRKEAERNPGDFDANYKLGKLLVDQGHAKDAILYIERASRSNPGNYENAYELAVACAATGNYERARSNIQSLLARQDKAELRHLLGEMEESLGNPLQAVREYQRAAELSPNESNVFDWGSELLLHHAPEPAIEIFQKGNQLFPRSIRMLLGLGVAQYAHGATPEAVRLISEASDLNPSDPDPYLFLGRIQAAEAIESDAIADKLRRFAELQPENAFANYYYAVSLWKRRTGPQDVEVLPKVESLLEKAIRLDSAFGPAYLQLGILHSELKDFPRAISAYQEAIKITPWSKEAHYRLAQVYWQTGERLEAEGEMQLYEQLSEKSAGEVDRERRDIKQFVYTLRGQNPASQPPQ
jgi:tetratricopeptide (TPR) repeat protein